MKSLLRAVGVSLILLSSAHSFAQPPLQGLQFGTYENFDVATWNIRFFPTEGDVTIQYVAALVQAMEIDVLAIQEIDDGEDFDQLLSLMQGYDGFRQGGDNLKLGYIYNNQSVEVIDHYNIFTGGNFGNPFPRRPYVFELSFFGEEEFVLINNHFKCCGNTILDESDFWDEETRRAYASELLKDYMDEEHPNDRVIMLGDLNDLLTDNPANNVFQVFYDDPLNYAFADQDIAEGPSSEWSYPSWPSHLDHILITNELFSVLNDEDTRVETIQIGDFFPSGFEAYDELVSDHLPVALTFNPESILPLSSSSALRNYDELIVYPNPSQGKVFFKNAPHNVQSIKVYDQLGTMVRVVDWSNNSSDLAIDLSGAPAGVYQMIVFTANGKTLSTKVLIGR
jgi:endonuclease/exonuclease/phosphatase family metal-dependent hydrolase